MSRPLAGCIMVRPPCPPGWLKCPMPAVPAVGAVKGRVTRMPHSSGTGSHCRALCRRAVEHHCNFSEARAGVWHGWPPCLRRALLPGPASLTHWSCVVAFDTALPSSLLAVVTVQVIITQGIEVKTKTQNKKCQKAVERVRSRGP